MKSEQSNLTQRADSPTRKKPHHADPLMRFADQDEIKNTYDLYSTAYERQHQSQKSWDNFNNFHVSRAIDNAAVVFDHQVGLASSKNEPANKGNVARQVATRMIEAAGFFLAQNKSETEVPDKLRICLAVNHNNKHWTSVIVTIDGFKDAYKNIKKDSPFPKSTAENEFNTHNEANNKILSQIGIKIGLPNNETNINNDDAKKIFNYFKTDNRPIHIEHLDSWHHAQYHRSLENSLSVAGKSFKLESTVCSPQIGYTCADHTTMNAFVRAHYTTIPAINEDANLTSAQLRGFTNSTRRPPKTVDHKEEQVATATKLLNNALSPTIVAERIPSPPSPKVERTSRAAITPHDAAHAESKNKKYMERKINENPAFLEEQKRLYAQAQKSAENAKKSSSSKGEKATDQKPSRSSSAEMLATLNARPALTRGERFKNLAEIVPSKLPEIKPDHPNPTIAKTLAELTTLEQSSGEKSTYYKSALNQLNQTTNLNDAITILQNLNSATNRTTNPSSKNTTQNLNVMIKNLKDEIIKNSTIEPAQDPKLTSHFQRPRK